MGDADGGSKMNPGFECRFQAVASNLEKMVSGALAHVSAIAEFPNGKYLNASAALLVVYLAPFSLSISASIQTQSGVIRDNVSQSKRGKTILGGPMPDELKSS